MMAVMTTARTVDMEEEEKDWIVREEIEETTDPGRVVVQEGHWIVLEDMSRLWSPIYKPIKKWHPQINKICLPKLYLSLAPSPNPSLFLAMSSL